TAASAAISAGTSTTSAWLSALPRPPSSSTASRPAARRAGARRPARRRSARRGQEGVAVGARRFARDFHQRQRGIQTRQIVLLDEQPERAGAGGEGPQVGLLRQLDGVAPGVEEDRRVEAGPDGVGLAGSGLGEEPGADRRQ